MKKKQTEGLLWKHESSCTKIKDKRKKSHQHQIKYPYATHDAQE